MKSLFYLFILFISTQVFGQETKKDTSSENLIQFSGIIVDDSLGAIPYAYIYEKSSRRGTMSDFYGYFSFVAEKGDTIVFSSIQYKDAILVIPDTLSTYRYSIIQMLFPDKTILEKVDVYPWPSKEEFIDAFVNLELSSDLEVARKNLKRQELAAQAKGVSSGSYLNYQNAIKAEQQKIYYVGQAPPNNLLNPIAWAKFIQAWKNGELKVE